MTQATHCNPTASELRILSNKNDYYVFHYLYLVKTPHTLSGHSTILYKKIVSQRTVASSSTGTL